MTNHTAAFALGQGVTDGLVYELRIDEGQGSLLRERALEQLSVPLNTIVSTAEVSLRM
jgi:hypothetical protein